MKEWHFQSLPAQSQAMQQMPRKEAVSNQELSVVLHMPEPTAAIMPPMLVRPFPAYLLPCLSPTLDSWLCWKPPDSKESLKMPITLLAPRFVNPILRVPVYIVVGTAEIPLSTSQVWVSWRSSIVCPHLVRCGPGSPSPFEHYGWDEAI